MWNTIIKAGAVVGALITIFGAIAWIGGPKAAEFVTETVQSKVGQLEASNEVIGTKLYNVERVLEENRRAAIQQQERTKALDEKIDLLIQLIQRPAVPTPIQP